MSTLYIPPEILNLIVKETEKESLCNFSLVCRAWRWPARKKIWEALTVNKSSFDRLIAVLEENQDLRGYVKQLSFASISLTLGRSFTTEENRSTNEKLKRVLQLLPNIFSLVIPRNSGINKFRSEVTSSFESTFGLPNLTSLVCHGVGEKDVGLELLGEIIGKAVNLRSLELTIHLLVLNFRSIQQCSILENLTINNRSNTNFFDPSHPILPLTSLINLKKLNYTGRRNSAIPVGIQTLIRQNSSSLVYLNSITCSLNILLPLLSNFSKLKSLTCSLPANLSPNPFQNSPPSLEVVDLASGGGSELVSVSQLQILQAHPRPILYINDIQVIYDEERIQLEEILEMSQLLPLHIKLIYYHYPISPEVLDEILSKRKNRSQPVTVFEIYLQSLHLIRESGDIDAEQKVINFKGLFEEVQNRYVSEFKVIDIILSVGGWALS